MTVEIAKVLVIIVLMTISFFTELLPLAFTALMVPVALQATGILKASQAWSGFSSTTIITWIGLFIIGAAFAKTNFTYQVKKFVTRNAKGSAAKVTLMVLLACTLLGLMTSATSTIAVLTPILMEICNETGISPKRIFKPVADVATWGSVQMLPIGSSLSYFILFNTYLEAAGTDLRYGLFDFTYIKLPMWVVLLAYYVFINRKLKVKINKDFLQGYESTSGNSYYTPKQEKTVVTIFFANVVLMVIASFTKIVPVYLVSITFASLLVGLRLISEKEALQSVSWSTVFLVAGTLPLSTAINVSGTGKWLSSVVTSLFPSMNNPVLLATAFAVFAMILTQFVSNTAVWAVLSPIAATMALSMSMDPRLVVAGVASGAIICFATPMAAPAPAYAYSISNFTMKEYIKMGWFPCVLMTLSFIFWAPIVLKYLYY
ncbi:MAG: SLC13 family permease [Pyramidobacter sp.]